MTRVTLDEVVRLTRKYGPYGAVLLESDDWFDVREQLVQWCVDNDREPLPLVRSELMHKAHFLVKSTPVVKL